MRAYLKRLSERLSAQPGAPVTDLPVQQADRQRYNNGPVTDIQLAGAAAVSARTGTVAWSPVASSGSIGAATVAAAQIEEQGMPAMRQL